MGCLMGSSFCERVNSAGNQVVVAGNTMLSDDYIKKLVVLRMNREFMKFMRREYTLNLHQFEKFGSVARARDQKEDDPVVMPAVDVMCA
jgi:Rad3-related DNA helicase